MNFRRPLICLLAVVVTLAGGCRTTPDTAPADDPDLVARAEVETDESDDRFQVLESDEAVAGDNTYEIMPGTGRFIDAEAAAREPMEQAEDGEIIFNFEGQPLQEVIKAILGDLLQENYVIAPGIQGDVTFSTSEPVPMSDVLSILEMLLSWNNASLVHRDGRYHVLPQQRAIPGNLRPVIGTSQARRGYEVRVFPLEYIAPTEMETLLRPYARENAFVSVDNARGLLILAGTQQELANYQQTIDIFDVDWLEGMSVGIYPLERVEADTVVGELESIFGEGAGTPLAGMFRFMPIERLNAVMVITPQPQYLDKAVEWVQRLDRGGSEAGTRLYVYAVKNVKATDLADTLNDVFQESGSRSGVRRDRDISGDVAPGLETGTITSINDPRRQRDQEAAETTGAAPAVSGGADQEGLALVSGEEIRLTAVEESNSLLIRATPQQYDAVLGAIKRLDIVPLQVLVEVKVLEVTLTDELQYGVQWFFENAVLDFDLGGGDNGGDGSGTQVKGLFDADGVISSDRAGTISDSGLTYSILGGDVAAFVSALENHTDVHAIAAPSMMVLNNKQATINVGTQIPVNSPIFNTGTGSNIGQSRVQFRDTGVTLDVTPRVNPGGMVFMEVSQEVSAPSGAPDSNGNVAVSQRRLNTEIAVQSGQTVVLGGLIQLNLNEGQRGVPFLSRVPLVGALFGRHTDNALRTELLVVITPKVVSSIDEARDVTEEYKRRMRGLKPIDIERVDIQE